MPAGPEKAVIMMTSPGAVRDRGAKGPAALRAEIGDALVIDQPGGAGQPRIGEITALLGPDGSPPYLVRWLAGDYESMIVPGPGARVEKRHRPQVTAA
jgi:hypothetical protein